MSELAVEILRSNRVESRAYADVAVVDSLGRVVAWMGDPYAETFWRSSAKPFQAMPVILSGAADHFGLDGRDLAIVAGSHGGEPRHVERVTKLLEKISAEPSDLVCGIHWPVSASAHDRMTKVGETPTTLHNNCSGKHTGMLAVARQLQISSAGYHESTHPVQQAILDNVRRMTGLSPNAELVTAVDGCGVPTFYLPLARMAFAYAQLVDPRGLEAQVAAAAVAVAEAMRRYPELVSGEDRLELRLAETSGYRFFAKGGAEAVFCLGIPERGWGVAMKVSDGGARTLAPAVLAVLAELELLDQNALDALHELWFPVLRNHTGLAVGSMRPVLRLHRGRLAVG